MDVIVGEKITEIVMVGLVGGVGGDMMGGFGGGGW